MSFSAIKNDCGSAATLISCSQLTDADEFCFLPTVRSKYKSALISLLYTHCIESSTIKKRLYNFDLYEKWAKKETLSKENIKSRLKFVKRKNKISETMCFGQMNPKQNYLATVTENMKLNKVMKKR